MDPLGQEKLGELLRFLAPGFLHGIGNALFAVQGHGQLVGVSGRDPLRERQAILAAAARGGRLVQVLRTVLGEGDTRPQQAGVMLQGLAELLRVALRERALTLTVRHTSRESPRRIAGACFCRVIAGAVRMLAQELPAAFTGEVYLDLVAQSDSGLSVDVGVQEHPEFLPFPFDVGPLAAALKTEVGEAGVQVQPFSADRRIRLDFPFDGLVAFTESRGNLQGPFTGS